MNFTSLYYFVKVAEELNISKAAEKLYISQQSLSKHLLNLEEELNTKLLERKPQMRLTYSGVCLLRYAKAILDLQNQMLIQMDSITSEQTGSIIIGTTSIRSKLTLSSLLSIYREKCPNVEIHVDTAGNDEIRSKLLRGDVDVIICMEYQVDTSLVETYTLYQNAFCVIVPKKYLVEEYGEDAEKLIAQAREYTGLDTSLLNRYPVLLSKKSHISRVAERFLSKNNITPKVVLESNDEDTLLNSCMHGMGITFCFDEYAELYFQMNGNEDVVVFPIHDASLCGNIIIAYLKDKYKGLPLQEFINIAKDVYHIEKPEFEAFC